MIERDKQKEKTSKNNSEEARHAKDTTNKPQPTQAGEATSREDAQDKGYAQRIEEKTKKH